MEKTYWLQIDRDSPPTLVEVVITHELPRGKVIVRAIQGEPFQVGGMFGWYSRSFGTVNRDWLIEKETKDERSSR